MGTDMYVYAVRKLCSNDKEIQSLLCSKDLTTLDFDNNFGLDIKLPLGYGVEPIDSFGNILYGNNKNIAYDYGTYYPIQYPSYQGRVHWVEGVGYVWYQEELIYCSKWWPMFRYVQRHVQKDLGIKSDCYCVYIPVDDVILRAIREPDIIANDPDTGLFKPDGYRDWERSEWVPGNSWWGNLKSPKGTDLYFYCS